MKNVSSSPAVSAVDQLKTDWPKLSVIDRARSIDAIKRSGLSIRKIAKGLGKSESLLRHVLAGLEAPLVDRVRAHQGKISTNQLVRRAKAAAARRATMRDKDLAHQRERQAMLGAKLISSWLEENQLRGAYGQQIIGEAREQMVMAELAGMLPSVDPPAHPVAPAIIIGRCKPQEPLDDTMIFVAWYAKWLARWAIFVITDPDARVRALELALKTESRY